MQDPYSNGIINFFGSIKKFKKRVINAYTPEGNWVHSRKTPDIGRLDAWSTGRTHTMMLG